MRGKCGWARNKRPLNLTIKAAHKNYLGLECDKRNASFRYGAQKAVFCEFQEVCSDEKIVHFFE